MKCRKLYNVGIFFFFLVFNPSCLRWSSYYLLLHKIPINKFNTVHIQVIFICAALVFQAVLQSDMGPLLEQVGTGKESLSFMKRRMRRLAAQWASAARRLDDKLRNHWREQKRVNMRLHATEGGEKKCRLREPVSWFHLFKVSPFQQR